MCCCVCVCVCVCYCVCVCARTRVWFSKEEEKAQGELDEEKGNKKWEREESRRQFTMIMTEGSIDVLMRADAAVNLRATMWPDETRRRTEERGEEEDAIETLFAMTIDKTK